jgi:hypothetical protein
MSEVPLYAAAPLACGGEGAAPLCRWKSSKPNGVGSFRRAAGMLQRYLAHKKQRLPRTLQ